MNRLIRRIGLTRRRLILAGFALSGFGILSAPVYAQTNIEGKIEGKLAARVNLTLGTTTLSQLVTALTMQTGLTIEAAPALQDRKITVQMQDLPARDALDSLAELNDWTWRQLSTGVIRIARSRPNLPQKAASIRPLMRASMPKDLRDFLGIGFTDRELRKKTNPEHPYEDMGMVLKSSTLLRVSKCIQAEQTDLPLLLPPSLWRNDKVPYTKMPPLAQQKLLLLLTLKIFDGAQLKMLQEEIYPYGLEASEITFRMNQQQNRLEIGRIIETEDEHSAAVIVVQLPPHQGE